MGLGPDKTVAAEQSRIIAVGLLSPYLQRKRLRAALPYIDGKVLDFGCGTGELAAHVPADRYVGYDVNQQALQKARANWPDYIFVDEVPGGPFDTVAALAVLEHLDDPEAVVKQLTAISRKLVATTPHPSYGWVHNLTARIGLADLEHAHEHTELLDETRLRQIGANVGKETLLYHRFLGPMNQLIVLI